MQSPRVVILWIILSTKGPSSSHQCPRPSFTDEEALAFHAGGKPGKLEITPTKPMATQRDLSAGLFARRGGAGAGDRGKSRRSPTTIPPRAIWWR